MCVCVCIMVTELPKTLERLTVILLSTIPPQAQRQALKQAIVYIAFRFGHNEHGFPTVSEVAPLTYSPERGLESGLTTQLFSFQALISATRHECEVLSYLLAALPIGLDHITPYTRGKHVLSAILQPRDRP